MIGHELNTEYTDELVIAQCYYITVHMSNLVKRINGEEVNRKDVWYEDEALNRFCMAYCRKYKVDESYFNYFMKNEVYSCKVPTIVLKNGEM